MKCILWYLLGTIRVCHIYDHSKELTIGTMNSVDFDFFGDRNKRLSTNRNLFGFGGNLVN